MLWKREGVVFADLAICSRGWLLLGHCGGARSEMEMEMKSIEEVSSAFFVNEWTA